MKELTNVEAEAEFCSAEEALRSQISHSLKSRSDLTLLELSLSEPPHSLSNPQKLSATLSEALTRVATLINLLAWPTKPSSHWPPKPSFHTGPQAQFPHWPSSPFQLAPKPSLTWPISPISTLAPSSPVSTGPQAQFCLAPKAQLGWHPKKFFLSYSALCKTMGWYTLNEVSTPQIINIHPQGWYTSNHLQLSTGLVHPFHEVGTPQIIYSFPQGWYTLSTRLSSTGLVHPFHEVGTPQIIYSFPQGWYTLSTRLGWYTLSMRLVHLTSFTVIHRFSTPFPRGWYTSNHLQLSTGLVHPFHEVGTPHIIYISSTRLVHPFHEVGTPHIIYNHPQGWYTSNHLHSSTGLVHPFHEVGTPHFINIHPQGWYTLSTRLLKKLLSVVLVHCNYRDGGIVGGVWKRIILREVFGGGVSSFVKTQRRCSHSSSWYTLLHLHFFTGFGTPSTRLVHLIAFIHRVGTPFTRFVHLIFLKLSCVWHLKLNFFILSRPPALQWSDLNFCYVSLALC
ncbi:hypothetical protein V8G54_010807 [Vigna mungo]|uniref:Uncharacterized protein n=1 Tax=Vigna mungo TaxID=3915 RepID=A0AAQ3NXT1_VIGMU